MGKKRYQASEPFISLIKHNTLECFMEQTAAALDTAQKISVEDWAEEHRILENCAEEGPFRLDRTPYMREIYEAVQSSDPETRIVAVSKGAQLTFTELAMNFILHRVHQKDGSVLYLSETQEKAEGMMKDRINPALQRPPFKRVPQHSVKYFRYPGGSLYIRGANSSASFSSVPTDLCIADEIARYKTNIDGEGDAVSLLKGRQGTFANAKIYAPSTPVDNDEGSGSFTASM